MISIRFAIDRGGTFTDIYAEIVTKTTNHEGTVATSIAPRVMKLLSVDPDHYADAPTEGIRRILADTFPHLNIPTPGPVPTAPIDWIRMGTTVATNALLEHRGHPSVFLVTEGFADVLRIANQARPDLFDLALRRHTAMRPLYRAVVEVPERLAVDATTGAVVVEKPLDVAVLRERLQQVRAEVPEATSAAVALMHSYARAEHENAVGDVCRQLGFTHVSLSSQLTPMVKLVPRGFTAVVDAYLTPKIREYIRTFSAGFDANLAKVNVQFMQSDGGLCHVDRFTGYRAVLSGPAGGVVGYARTAYESRPHHIRVPVIGLDMGGTSTDVSRYAGRYEHVFETQTAGVTIQAPQLDIQTVAAGGGSRLFFRSGLLHVGPESAGAYPGPVCYRRPGGVLAVTDANVMLGRVLPEFFPKIFGESGNEPLDVPATRAAFRDLTAQVNVAKKGLEPMTPEEVALGFVDVANEAMCRPIRNLTEARGHDARTHALACFGGAGGQHACAIARNLGMETVFIHRYSGILSAYGIGQADSVVEKQEPLGGEMETKTTRNLATERLKVLSEIAQSDLLGQGVIRSTVRIEEYLNLRYSGTDFAIMIPRPPDGDYCRAFEEEYVREHGFSVSRRSIEVDDVRVRAVGSVSLREDVGKPASGDAEAKEPQPCGLAKSYFRRTGWSDTPVYRLEDLQPNSRVTGPALTIDVQAGVTVVVEPDCILSLTTSGDIEIAVTRTDGMPKADDNLDIADPVSLSLFSHRFMGIAEQMGRTLQRTAISTNIKERLDFSCAVFDDNGGLVANAPHVPVHLGSMQDAVHYQIDALGDSWKEGEVILANHPSSGGTHLPDITIITPVFSNGKPCFYVASRGHQCDIGGISPGSMPPFSKSLADEGMATESMKIVEDGEFREELLVDALRGAGCRLINDVVSDLKAQIAANQKGISLVKDLIANESLPKVIAYMKHIQNAANHAVRSMLTSISESKSLAKIDHLSAEDCMDDGSIIRLRITLDQDTGSANFDFAGTDAEVQGNTNAPPAIAKSAIIYCLRCLVEDDIPLNQGCLEPVTVNLPTGSILSPSPEAGVVGGNVLTSQRITDVILKAFGAAAASQGCMNNFTFGDATFGYYETIAGGAGAGPTWDGASGVHTHMTNTRITDGEILERRYPVKLVQFRLRSGSGGSGSHRGGDGVVREVEMRRDGLTVSILSERRVGEPYGLAGGNPGARGRNLWRKRGGGEEDLGGKNSVVMAAGDRMVIMTPGGGGFGQQGD